jgi:hypothetical protein
MATHMSIGFLQDEKHLEWVDKDFRELARLMLQIPGFGSFGVSCSGHFRSKENGYSEDFFNPVLSGHLGLAAIPEMEHIPELLKIIYASTKEDSDANMRIMANMCAPWKQPVYEPSMDLRPYTSWKTKSGLYVAKLAILIGDNGLFDSMNLETYGGGIEVKGNEEKIPPLKKRYEEIKNFWKSLEDKVRIYNQDHGFTECDYKKDEFMRLVDQ